MVLRLAALGLVLSACIGGGTVVRSPQKLSVATVVLREDDKSRDLECAPEAVVKRLQAALLERNLGLDALQKDTWLDGVAAARTTNKRLAHVASLTKDDAVLLVETQASFYSQLNGRFRWTVHGKATFARVGALDEAQSAEFEFPAYLDFEHLGAADALSSASFAIADHVGRLLDAMLAPPPVRKAEKSAGNKADSIYFVLVDRFRNGDPSNDGAIDLQDPEAFHGGDLQGVLDELDYIQSLGVTTVWLSPVAKMRTAKFMGHGAFHGYWVEDFAQVEPRFGDRRLLRRLSDALHARGMKLVLDVVLNHVGYDAPLLTQKPGWFHHNPSLENWNDRTQVETWGVHGLPDLAQENAEVFDYLVATSKQWIDDVRPDGFRLDAVKHVPLAFWAKYNDAIRAHAGEDFMLLGEELDGNPTHLGSVMREGHFTHVFDFPLYFALVDVVCKGARPEMLDTILWQDTAYPHPDGLVTLVDNHDFPRFVTSCGGDPARLTQALDYLRKTRGTPVFAYGTEVALPGANETESRADMRFPADRRSVRGALRHEPAVLPPVDRTTRASVPLEVAGVPAAAAGDRVFAVGSAEFGAWQVLDGVELTKGPGGSWSATVERPAAATYAYKFVLRRADASVVWEDRPNRYLSVRAAKAHARHWNDASEID